ncbi:MAG: glutamate--tRNA ligase [Bacteriovoracaceae bacterium]|nr:glutamate--tRNA ligase [Bacteriovoracaceae bacterium]
MSVRVRFAPSPTGYLHIGGARTALYNYIFAKAMKGSFILRIDDTDLERSKKEYETSQMNDLKWLGILWDEGPDKPGDFGPYYQSKRLNIYKKYADQLIDQGLAYYCFCSEETLAAKKEVLVEQKLAPHYDGTCKKIDPQVAHKKVEGGEVATIRFKAPIKAYTFVDKVRKEVTFPAEMVGDFVIVRANGFPVYNFCSTVDDWLMKITHVIRAEEHLPNTLRQLMIYEALGATPPEFVHLSLLVGADRQKLSKRHGATSVTQYRDDSILPNALVNYLCLLGWSHPTEKSIFFIDEIIECFNLDRFIKTAAFFDVQKLQWINGQHLRMLSNEDLVSAMEQIVSSRHGADHGFNQQNLDWKLICVELFKEKIESFKEMLPMIEDLFSQDVFVSADLKEILEWESTPLIKTYITGEVDNLVNQGRIFANESDFSKWSSHIKKELKIKGKFLFKGMRAILTGRDHGADLKVLSTLTPLTTIQGRISNLPG